MSYKYNVHLRIDTEEYISAEAIEKAIRDILGKENVLLPGEYDVFLQAIKTVNINVIRIE